MTSLQNYKGTNGNLNRRMYDSVYNMFVDSFSFVSYSVPNMVIFPRKENETTVVIIYYRYRKARLNIPF